MAQGTRSNDVQIKNHVHSHFGQNAYVLFEAFLSTRFGVAYCLQYCILKTLILTVQNVLNGHCDPFVESPGVRCGMESDTISLVASFPVVESRHHLVVLEVTLDSTSQNHLPPEKQEK